MKHTKIFKIADEKGFASLIIALIIIIVLGLLTVGFAELMRHSSQQALNRQLSNQAYYAAESGVNDAVRAIRAGFTKAKSNCTDYTGASAWAKYFSSPSIDANADANSPRWTCLLVNPHPTSIEYDTIGTTEPKVITVKPIGASGSTMKLHIAWQGASGTNETNFRNECNGNNCFPKQPSWNSVGVLRIAITPLNDLTRAGLVANTYTALLYPCKSNQCSSAGAVGSASHNGYSNRNGEVINANCNTGNLPKFCKATISNVPVTGSGYLIRLRSIYNPTSVAITGDSGVQFSGAQTLIDSTGKAKNVLKRIQVRIPVAPSYNYPGFATAGTGSICKKIVAAPNIFADDAPGGTGCKLSNHNP